MAGKQLSGSPDMFQIDCKNIKKCSCCDNTTGGAEMQEEIFRKEYEEFSGLFVNCNGDRIFCL